MPKRQPDRETSSDGGDRTGVAGVGRHDEVHADHDQPAAEQLSGARDQGEIRRDGPSLAVAQQRHLVHGAGGVRLLRRRRIFEGTAELILPDGTVAVEATGKYFNLIGDTLPADELEAQEWRVYPAADDPQELEIYREIREDKE